MIEIVAGYEPREAIGFQVAAHSAIRRTSEPISFIPLIEQALRLSGIYQRPHERRGNQTWCPISDAPMATAFANSRFLTLWLGASQWVLFCDFADMLWLDDPAKLFDLADERFAVMVVKRSDYQPDEAIKMDDQAQTSYPRKNWSSVVLWNRFHKASEKLTLEMVNELPGRDLHRFCWLDGDEIGELPREWNHLVGVDSDDTEPKLLHFTLGIPTMPGHAGGPWADVWRSELAMLDATR